ncbi:MAG: DNA-directed RNA polymerase subunit omega [Verrucomicrobiota bacterium]
MVKNKKDIVKEALDKIENPQILINMVSRRVRQLGMGYRPLINVNPKMTFLDVALAEVADGKLSYELLSSVDDDDNE